MIAIVTDSTSDIPDELAVQNKINIVRNLIIIEGQSLEDGKGLSRQEFYQRLPAMTEPPSTATASTGTYIQLYESLFKQGATYILSIHASSLLSGIYNAAHAAAEAFGEFVQVIDSGQVSLGLGFQALAAAEAAARGATLDTTLALVNGMRERMHVVAMLDTLEYVRRSGRVSWARARIGNLLSIKPFIELKAGKVLSRGEARTRSKGIRRLKEFLLGLGSLERLAVLHSNAETDARQFLLDLNLNLPNPALIVNVTTVIGAHVGPNALGFAAVVKE